MSGPGDNLLVVLGPTASGKTALGVNLARRFGGDIVSADSRQVYRELDIGAGKDREEYTRGGPAVACHLIDVAGLDRLYSIYHYQRDFRRVLDDLRRRRVLPVMVGGSGLYLEAVLLRYPLAETPPDRVLRAELEALPEDALRRLAAELGPRLPADIDTDTRRRTIRAIEIALHPGERRPAPLPELRPLVLGVSYPPGELRRRIAERLSRRLENGLVEEVERLLAAGVPARRLDSLGLEYRFVTRFLQGAIPSRRELFAKLHTAICAFARRQRTWFRRMERRGVHIHWLEGADRARAEELAAAWLQPPKAG